MKTPGPRVAGPAARGPFGEVVMITVPLKAVPDLAGDLASLLPGKVVLDSANAYVQRDADAARNATSHAQGSAGWAAEMFPGARWVKAFNSVYYKTLETEAHRSGDRVGIPLSTIEMRWRPLHSGSDRRFRSGASAPCPAARSSSRATA